MERKYYCKNPAPDLIDCLFYRLKHFSEFDSETAACSYIYSSCRTQQFPLFPDVRDSALFVPHRLTYPSAATFCCFLTLSHTHIYISHGAYGAGRFEKLLTAREFSLVPDVSNWSCSSLHLFISLYIFVSFLFFSNLRVLARLYLLRKHRRRDIPSLSLCAVKWFFLSFLNDGNLTI